MKSPNFNDIELKLDENNSNKETWKNKFEKETGKSIDDFIFIFSDIKPGLCVRICQFHGFVNNGQGL